MKAKSITKLIIFLFMFIQNSFGTLVYLVDHDNESNVIGKINVNFEKLDPDIIAQAIKIELKIKDSIKIEFFGDLKKENSIFIVETENGWVYPKNKTTEIIITVVLPDKTHKEFLVNPNITILDLKNLISKITSYKNFQQKLTLAGKNLSNNQALVKFNKKTLELNIIQSQPITFKVILDNVEIADEFSIPSDKTIGTLRFEILKKLAIVDQTEVTKINFKGMSDYSSTLSELSLDEKTQPITIRAYYKLKMPHETSWRGFLDNFYEYEKKETCQNKKITDELNKLKPIIQDKLIEIASNTTFQFQHPNDAKERLKHIANPTTSEAIKIFIQGIISDTMIAHLLAKCVRAKKISGKEISLNELLENQINIEVLLNSLKTKIQEKLDPMTESWVTFLMLFYDWNWHDPESKKILGSSYEAYFTAKSDYYKDHSQKSWKNFISIFRNFFLTKNPLGREIASTSMEDLRVYLAKRIDLILKITGEIVETVDSEKDILAFFNIFKPENNEILQEKLEARIKSTKGNEKAILNTIESCIYQNILNPYLSARDKKALYAIILNEIPDGLRSVIQPQIDAKFKPKLEVIETLGEFFAQRILNEYLSNKIQSWYIYENRDLYMRTIPTSLSLKNDNLAAFLKIFNSDSKYFIDTELEKFLITMHYVYVPSIIYYSITQRAQAGLSESMKQEKHDPMLYENFTRVIQEYREKHAKSELNGKPIAKPIPGQINIPDALKDLFEAKPAEQQPSEKLQAKLVRLRNNLTELKTKLHQLQQKLETLRSRL
ncbi:MAG: ubiquitin-like domain-containing protein [bacterium]